MSNREFVYPAKSLHQGRNKFKMPHQHKTTFNHGKLIPLDLVEVLPGDTFKIDLACLIRMSTPIAPIMDNITMHIAAYFVPSRLIYENFEQLMGANKTGSWTQDPTIYTIPKHEGTNSPMSIGDYLGIGMQGSGIILPNVSVLPGRAYYLIWNEFYRNQNVTAPYAINRSSTGEILVSDTQNYGADPLPLGKYSDYFTKCLPQPQKGADVLIPMADIPVGIVAGSTTTLSSDLQFGLSSGVSVVSDEFKQGTIVGDNTTKVIANNVSNTINDLRFAFQLQKFYEKDARYGTRFFEMLNGHFGVSNPDLVLSRPEFLGEMNFRINIDQVLSTAGYAAGTSTTVGAPGANSVTAKKGGLCTKSFTEPGYLLIVGGTRHDHTYCQGIHRLWTRNDRLDFYDPCFANIGEQPVLNQEIFYLPSAGNKNAKVQKSRALVCSGFNKPDALSGIKRYSAQAS